MRLVVDNVSCRAISGGVDNLLDFDVMQVLREYLRVRPDGYEHSTAYKKRGWDGWQYFINTKGVFATGFLPHVAAYLTEIGVEIKLEDNRTNLPRLNPEFDSFVGNIWDARKEKYEPWHGRDYQVWIAKKIDNYITVGDQQIYFPRGIFDAATNAGKNSIAALVCNNLPIGTRITFMVSGRLIYKQAVAFFSDVMGEPCGEVNDKKFEPKRITVCMVKSLYNKAKKSMNVKVWMASEQALIVDESDEAGSQEYSACLSLHGAGMRIFISGTPLDSSRVNNMVAIGLSGNVLGTITNDYLIKHGWSQEPLVTILLNDTPTFMLKYNDEVEKTIHFSKERCRQISLNVLSKYPERRTVITFTEKQHGYFMLENLRAMHPELRIEIVHGTAKERDSIIDTYSRGEIDVLLTSKILQRGANIPIIQTLVHAGGGKSKTGVKQFSGRALRHDGIEDTVLIFDFYDIGKYVGDHSRRRIRYYQAEGFKVEKNYPDRRGKPVL